MGFFGQAGLVLGLAGAYCCADILLNHFGFSECWTIIWPLNGITIALLLMRPRRLWPAILLGVGLGTGVGECLDHNSFASELWLRTFSLVEIYLSALLLPAFTSLDQWLRKPRIFLQFSLSLVVGPGVSGLLAATYFHVTQHQLFRIALDDWSVADALGIAVMMPLALSLGSMESRELFRGARLLRTAPTLGVAFTLMIVLLWISRYPLLFLLFPTLLAVDLLLSFSGSAIAAAGLCFISIYGIGHNHGIFGLWNQHLPVSRDVALQVFLAFHVIALFPASILIRDRRRLVEDLNSSNAQLLLLASLDGLTGIANRRSLDTQFEQEWKRAVRLQTPLSLIMLDVDLFKEFNDLYGHQAGDECLRSVARVLNDPGRRAQDHVARFGGEEFALLLPHTDLSGAHQLAEKIRVAIAALGIPHAHSANGCVTISLGCSSLTPILGSVQGELIALADAALYEAKHAGRNCVRPARPVIQPLTRTVAIPSL